MYKWRYGLYYSNKKIQWKNKQQDRLTTVLKTAFYLSVFN